MWRPSGIPHSLASHEFIELYPRVLSVLSVPNPEYRFVVFDIDATVLRGHGDRSRPREEGMALLDEAYVKDLEIYFVTARPEFPENRFSTLEDLATVGIVTDTHHLFMLPPHVRSWEGISNFKADAITNIAFQTGKDCVLTVGDQWTDHLRLTQARRDQLAHSVGDVHVLFKHPVRNGWAVKLTE